MEAFLTLLKKDMRNAKQSIGPAIFLGVPLLLILGFGNEIEIDQVLSWRSAFWLSFFISITSLFYRSYGFEHRYKCFHVYKAFRVSKVKIFLSQVLSHLVAVWVLGFAFLFFTNILFSPRDLDLSQMSLLIFAVSLALAPLGSLIGLLLQFEREFLFALFFIPLTAPIILASHHLSLEGSSSSWAWLFGAFILLSGFMSSLLFEFFFDELSQAD